jgi:hypothetical protein
VIPHPSRRRVLRLAGAGLSVGLAGCTTGRIERPGASGESQHSCEESSLNVHYERQRATPRDDERTARGADDEHVLVVHVRLAEGHREEPARLRGHVNLCSETFEADRTMSHDETTTFSAKGHHCDPQYTLWLSGCRDATRSTAP